MKGEKKKKAVALSYQAGSDVAPRVVASGHGLTAENICRIAQENYVPVYKNESLVDRLVKQELNSAIPPDLYTAVAEVMAFLYRVDKQHGRR